MSATTANDPVNADEQFRRRVQKKYVDQVFKAFQGDSRSAEEILEAELSRRRKPEPKYSVSNILWFTLACIIFYWSDFYLALRYDPRIDRFWLNAGGLLLLVNVVIAAFLIVWVSWVRKVHSDDWEKLYPAAIPIATSCFALGAFCLFLGLWPLWRWLTPVILFSLFMGLIVTIAMLPDFGTSQPKAEELSGDQRATGQASERLHEHAS